MLPQKHCFSDLSLNAFTLSVPAVSSGHHLTGDPSPPLEKCELDWALSIGEVFTKYSDQLCDPRVLGLKSLWTQFLSCWMPIAALRWLTSLGWWEMRRDSSLKKFGDKDKESTFPEGNRAAWRCEGVHGNPDNKKIPTDHFPVHNTCRNLTGRHLPAGKSAEPLWAALSRPLSPPSPT